MCVCVSKHVSIFICIYILDWFCLILFNIWFVFVKVLLELIVRETFGLCKCFIYVCILSVCVHTYTCMYIYICTYVYFQGCCFCFNFDFCSISFSLSLSLSLWSYTHTYECIPMYTNTFLRTLGRFNVCGNTSDPTHRCILSSSVCISLCMWVIKLGLMLV